MRRKTAIRLDRANASAHLTLGLGRLYGSRDWDGAEGYMRRAIELNPSDIYLHTEYARFLPGTPPPV